MNLNCLANTIGFSVSLNNLWMPLGLSSTTVSHPPNDVVQLAVEEIYERERRADNLILFNVTESTSDVVEERKDHDIGEVIDICKALDVDVSSKLEKPTRLGKKTEDQPRPLRVTVNDAEVKRKIRSKAKNLQNLPTMSQVYIANDLTPIERKLLKEKKKKQNPPSSQTKQMTSTTREQVDQSGLRTQETAKERGQAHY